jgi:hypothetical protein
MAKRILIQEPTLDHLAESKDLVWDLHKAVNWYRCNPTSKQKEKKWVLEYVKTVLGKDEVDSYSNGTSFQYDFLGPYCRVASRLSSDISLPITFKETIDSRLASIKRKTASKKAQKKEKQETTIPKKSIQERIAEQVSEYIGEIEVQQDKFIDDLLSKEKNTFVMESWLKGREVKSVQARLIAKWYEDRVIPEILESLEGKCPQLNEAYSYLTKPQKKKYYKFLQGIVNDCMQSAQSSPRKARRKKVKTPEQLTSKVKYEKENKEFGLTSVSPSSIIGASKLIVFNTKYRQLSLYETLDPAGFIIKGTTIQNFSKDNSKTKTLRKPKEILKNCLGGIRAFNNAWNSLKTKEKTPTGRLNENTIILKVHK